MSNNEYGEDKNGVRELSIDDFNLNTKKCVTNQGKSGLIIFYQYWCPHCRNIVPEVVKANKKLKNKHLIMAVHGDNENNNMIFDNFGIMGIPSIKFMNSSGKITKDYDGARDSESLAKFIKNNNNNNKPNKKPNKKPNNNNNNNKNNNNNNKNNNNNNNNNKPNKKPNKNNNNNNNKPNKKKPAIQKKKEVVQKKKKVKKNIVPKKKKNKAPVVKKQKKVIKKQKKIIKKN
tara:strand:+ start:3234 stop:3926 length:693 start_codon:yes stop_codon:yes gene_type:complete